MRRSGAPTSTPWNTTPTAAPTHAAFGYLGLNIEDFLLSGRPPSPVERTYLTTGILEAAMISRGQGGRKIPTPHLATIAYQPGGKGAQA